MQFVFYLIAICCLFVVKGDSDAKQENVFAKGTMLLPLKFGNFRKSSSSCGTAMASYNGIYAYSNGEYQGTGDSCGGWTPTGYAYQVCFLNELINFNFKLQI